MGDARHIKSKSYAAHAGDRRLRRLGEVTDPRADLIRRLLEYQKYKAAAESLGSRAISGRDVFPRGSTAAEAEGPAPLADIGMFKLLDAFEAILKRTKDRSAFEVTSERISIQERMTQISDLLRVRGSCTFEGLFEKDVSRYEVVITFLALLEMTKMRLTRIYQADHQSKIHIQHALLDPSAPTIPPERDAEAFSGQETASVAERLDAQLDSDEAPREAVEGPEAGGGEVDEPSAELVDAEAELLDAEVDSLAAEAMSSARKPRCRERSRS